jgi:thioredoxin-related protein
VLCYDLDTADGLAEASYYGVLSTPTMIIEDDNENMLADFRGTVPSLQQVKNTLVR